jgi:hypothetical protein
MANSAEAKDHQVVSKKRVADHGEVYTRKEEVNAMLDLVKQETERIDSRFLEPACGTGNFLAEILERKLKIVETRYRKCQLDYEKNAVVAISSIYGVDILEDNVHQCRERLFGIFDWKYSDLFSGKTKDKCRESMKFILGKNIIWGNALTLETVEEVPKPITFSEWSLVMGTRMKRRDFTYQGLLNYEDLIENAPIFSMMSDMGGEVFLPDPKKEFPLTHFLEVASAEDA